MKRASDDSLPYGIGYVIFTGCRVMQVLLVARILGPGMFGVWSALAIYRQYGQFSDLGTSKGIGRLIPRLIHAGDQRQADLVQGLGWSVGMLATVVVSAVIVTHAYATRDAQTPWLVAGLVTLLLLLFLDKQYAFVLSVYQATGRVGEAGIWMGVLGALELLLGVPLTFWFGLPGLFVSLVVAILIVTWRMQQRDGVRLTLSFDKSILHKLMASSFLLMGFGLLNIAMHNIDRVAIVMNFGGGRELSHYHVAAVFAMMATQLPSILMTVLAPRIYRFGRDDLHELRTYLLLPTALIVLLAVAGATMLWAGLPLVFEWLLPDYRESLGLARILLIGELFFAVTMVMENVNIALGRAHYTLVIRWSFVGISFVLACWMLRHGSGLPAVAIVMSTGQACAWIAVSCLVTRALGISFLRYAILVMLPFAYGGILISISFLLFPQTSSAHLIGALLLCSFGVLPLLLTALARAELGVLEATQFWKLILGWWRANILGRFFDFARYLHATTD